MILKMIIVRVQKSLEFGHSGWVSKARTNAPSHFLSAYVGRKSQELVLIM